MMSTWPTTQSADEQVAIELPASTDQKAVPPRCPRNDSEQPSTTPGH
jgi:hypothetical protein